MERMIAQHIRLLEEKWEPRFKNMQEQISGSEPSRSSVEMNDVNQSLHRLNQELLKEVDRLRGLALQPSIEENSTRKEEIEKLKNENDHLRVMVQESKCSYNTAIRDAVNLVKQQADVWAAVSPDSVIPNLLMNVAGIIRSKIKE
jgi:septation ring formation regulator EzrA